MANDRPVTIPALGRQGFSLGCLYDLSTHQIYARKLWDEEELADEKLTIQEYGNTSYSYYTSNSQEDRCNALDVDAKIKLDIGGGAVEVEGSAKYVNASNSNSQVSSVTYTSKKVTKTKALNMSQLAPDKVTYRSMLDQEKNATHVISSITYGKNAHFKFESRVTDDEDKEAIAGRLKLAIQSINAEGEGGLDQASELKKFADKTRIRFFGDYSEITPPLNFAQVKDTILEIEQDETNPLGVPIKVTLTPLSSLTNTAMKIVAQLSAGAVNEAARLLQDIEDIQVILKTLEKSQTSAKFFEYRMIVSKVANSYRNEGTKLKGKLCEILPQIKGGGGEEKLLLDVIRGYDESPFSKAKTMKWLKTLEDEVVYVDDLIKLAEERGVPMATTKSKFNGEKLRAREGMFYFEAKILSCIEKEENGEVTLRSTGSVLDDEEFIQEFTQHWGNFAAAISDAGLRNDEAEVNHLFYLEFMAEEDRCDIKFHERGYEVLSEINTDVKVGNVKFEALNNTVTGKIIPRRGKTCQVAKEGGVIKLQLRYTEDEAEVDQGENESQEDEAEVDQGENESQWENRKDFSHPAEKTSFQLDLGELHGLHEGKDYIAQIRFEIRPGLASQWVPFQFRARERPKVKIVSSSPFLLEVGEASQIDCILEKGYPEPTIKWTRKGKNEDVLSTGRSLMFDNPTEENQAVYCVEVENVAGSDKQEILVEVSDTIADKKETLENMFERKMQSKLKEELGRISRMFRIGDIQPVVTVSDCPERAQNLVDGTVSEWWTGEKTAWVELNLGRDCQVTELKIRWWGHSVSKDYTVLAAGQDNKFQKVCDTKAELESPKGYNSWSRLPGWTQETHKIKIELRDGRLDPWNKGKWFGIRNIVVQGTDVDP